MNVFFVELRRRNDRKELRKLYKQEVLCFIDKGFDTARHKTCSHIPNQRMKLGNGYDLLDKGISRNTPVCHSDLYAY